MNLEMFYMAYAAGLGGFAAAGTVIGAVILWYWIKRKF